MNRSHHNRRRILRARMAIERAELALAMSELRESATPARIVRSLGGGVWASLLRQRAAATESSASALLGALRRYPLLASTLTALLPFARRFVMRRLRVKRVVIGAALAGAGWAAWRITQKK